MAAEDEELQKFYEEARRRGDAKNDPELARFLAEAVKRGDLKDLSQSSKATAPKTPTLPAQAPNYADPTAGRPSNLPPLSAPPKMDTGYMSAFNREYGSNNKERGLGGDVAQAYYNLAQDQGEHGLASMVPVPEDESARGVVPYLQRGLKLGAGLIDAVPAAGYGLSGVITDLNDDTHENRMRGVDKGAELLRSAVPFGGALTGYLEGLGTLSAAGSMPKGYPGKEDLESEGRYQQDSALGSIADMIETNPLEFALNAAPFAEGIARPGIKAATKLRDTAAIGDIAASGIADPVKPPRRTPARNASVPRTQVKKVNADFSARRPFKDGEIIPEGARPRVAIPRPKVAKATTPAAPVEGTPIRSETPIPGTNKTLEMEAVVDTPTVAGEANAAEQARADSISGANLEPKTEASVVKTPTPRTPRLKEESLTPTFNEAESFIQEAARETKKPLYTEYGIETDNLRDILELHNLKRKLPRSSIDAIVDYAERLNSGDKVTKSKLLNMVTDKDYKPSTDNKTRIVARQTLTKDQAAAMNEAASESFIENSRISREPTAPVTAPIAESTKTAAPAKKPSSDATLPGTPITYKEYQEYVGLVQRTKGKTYEQLSPSDKILNDKYEDAKSRSQPLEQEDADLLNANLRAQGKKPMYKMGDVTLAGRNILDRDNATRTKAAQSINASIKGSKAGDFETYKKAYDFLEDDANRYDDGEYRIDPKMVEPLQKYVDKHFKKFHEQYDPTYKEALEASDFAEQIVRESLEPNGSGRKATPETRAKYYRLRDEVDHGDYTLTPQGRKFKNNNSHLEADYLDSRADGVPGERGYNPEEAGVTDALRTTKTVKSAPIPEIEEGPSARQVTTTLDAKRQKMAIDSAKSYKDARLLDPEEIVFLSTMPEIEKAKIEAARSKAGLTSLFDFGEDGVGVVRTVRSKARIAVDKAVAQSERDIAANKVAIAKSMKGIDRRQAGAWAPVALADIAKDVALKLADKTLTGYESAARYIEREYGKAAKKMHRTIVDQARVFNASGDESYLPQGNIINRKGEEVDRFGQVKPLEEVSAGNVVNGPDVVRPGDTQPLPISRDKLDKVMQSRKVKVRQNATNRAIKVRAQSDLDADIAPPIRKFLRTVNASNKVYREQVKTGIHDARVEDNKRMDAIRNDPTLSREDRIRLMANERAGNKTPDVTVKKLAENMTIQDMNLIRKKIDAAGLPNYAYLNADEAFTNLMRGVPLRNHEAALLHRVLGKEFVDVLVDNRTVTRKNWDRLVTAGNLRTSLLFSYDMGALGRNGRAQSARLLVTNPAKLARTVGQALSASKDIWGVTTKVGGGYKARREVIQAKLESHPLFKEAQENGIKFGGIEDHQQKWAWDQDGNPIQAVETEEMYAARVLIDQLARQSREALTLWDKPGGAQVQMKLSPRMKSAMGYMASSLQAAEYGHNTLLNTYRMDMYEARRKMLTDIDPNFTPENAPEAYKEMTRSIMTETGRGEFTKWMESPQAASVRQVMQTVLLAPRFRKAAFDLTLGSVRKGATEIVRLNPKYAAPYEKSLKLMKDAEAMPVDTPEAAQAMDTAIQEAFAMRYKSLPQSVRIQSLKSMAAVVGIGATVMALAERTGSHVEKDWWNPDFGYIVWKDGTRTDVFGPDRKPVQLYLMMLNKAQQIANSEVRTNQQRMGMKQSPKTEYPSALDPIGLYFISGLAPNVQWVPNALRGKDYNGDTGANLLLNLNLPIMVNDIRLLGMNGYKRGGAAGAAAGVAKALPNYTGITTNVNRPKKVSGGGAAPSLPSLSGSLPSLPR